jgi:integrase/recombinase XerD
MLTAYRRHGKGCSLTSMGQRRCKCPVWVNGKVQGRVVRKALKTRNWEAAQKLVREFEVGKVPGVSVKEACEAFASDCEARSLSDASIGKYKLLGKELKERFADREIDRISVQDLRGYRESWQLSPISARKKLERLRTFFRFCYESGWISANPAKPLKAPAARATPTLPFSDEEIEKIFWAIDLFPEHGRHCGMHRDRIRAFVNVLRYSGMRIRDVVTLSREKIQNGKLILYTQKTGTAVFLPLPKTVIESLERNDDGDRFYFWTGNGTEKSGVSVWQRTLSKLVDKAAIANGHAHRFRDTFSVSLLQSGVSLETVSILLGHSSLKVTEKHYSPWVKSRQIALESEIEKAWKL